MISKGVMVSKQQRDIIVFLFFATVAIYIYWSIGVTSEGFQTTSSDCTKRIVADKPTYLCPSQDDADMLMNADPKRSGLLETDGLCYTSDALLNSKTNTSTFVCYNRPFGLTLDTTLNPPEWVKEDPLFTGDSTTADEENDTASYCNSYNSVYAPFLTSYQNTSTLLNGVSTIGLKNIQDSLNDLNGWNTTYCIGAGKPSANFQPVCTAIAGAITTITSIKTDTSANSLNSMITAVKQSYNEIHDDIYQTFLPSFHDAGCMTDPQLADYIANKNII